VRVSFNRVCLDELMEWPQKRGSARITGARYPGQRPALFG